MLITKSGLQISVKYFILEILQIRGLLASSETVFSSLDLLLT